MTTTIIPMVQRRDTDTNWNSSTVPLLDGQIGYNKTTGGVKIGNGESLWHALPDIRKQFQNVVTVVQDGPVGSADFICSESDSDKLAIQAVLDAVPTDTEIRFDGTFNIDGVISRTGKNLWLKGGKNTVFNCSNAGDDIPAIQLSGSVLLSTTLTTNVSKGSITVTLTSVTGVQTGDLIKIFNTDQWCPNETYDYPDQLTGEMYEISGVLSNTITLSQPLLRDYLAANTTIRIYHPASINLENIDFIGTGATDNVYGMKLAYVSNSTISECGFYNHGRRTLMLSSCYNIYLTRNNIKNSCYPGSGYGIGISDASTIINIYKNKIENCRHCIMAGTADFEGLNRAINIEGNTLIGANVSGGNVIDSHQMTIDYTIINNKIYPKVLQDTGLGAYAFYDGTKRSIFSNNYVCGGGGVKRRGAIGSCYTTVSNNIIEDTNGSSLYQYSSGGIGNSLTITDNELINCTMPGDTYGTGIDLNLEIYKNVEICNNTIDGCSADGINIKQPTNEIKSRFKIVNNIINNTRRHGIYLRRAAATDVITSSITGNIITDVNQSGESNVGIYLIDIASSDISNNIIDGAYYGIRENTLLAESATDDNRMINNRLKNCTIDILKTGAATIVSSNPGYRTENSGTATIATSETSIVVNHGLAAAPTRYSVTPAGNIGACWVTLITSTQFTINCASAPGSDTTVCWSAEVR